MVTIKYAHSYCWAHFQRKWLFQVLHVFDYLFTISKRKSAQYWRFWWNRVSERVKKKFFEKQKLALFGRFFDQISYQNHCGLIKADIVPKGAWWVQNWYFCASWVHVRTAPTLRVYSPEQGEHPQYPNHETIWGITPSGCSQRGCSEGGSGSHLDHMGKSPMNLAEKFYSCKNHECDF